MVGQVCHLLLIVWEGITDEIVGFGLEFEPHK
jgi:hypothetical protein